ncbi:hypothetical protein COBT_001929 [Conglomerata obtusa]
MSFKKKGNHKNSHKLNKNLNKTDVTQNTADNTNKIDNNNDGINACNHQEQSFSGYTSTSIGATNDHLAKSNDNKGESLISKEMDENLNNVCDSKNMAYNEKEKSVLNNKNAKWNKNDISNNDIISKNKKKNALSKQSNDQAAEHVCNTNLTDTNNDKTDISTYDTNKTNKNLNKTTNTNTASNSKSNTVNVTKTAPPKKRGPNIADIKKALADKQKAKEEAEREAKIREALLIKEKEKKEKEIAAKVEKLDLKNTKKEAKKVPRFSFLRKDVNKVNTETQFINDEPKENIKLIETNIYKSPITCILGHVDTGKTKLLDKLRHTNVQLGEAGGITQQIGATFFPNSYLKKSCLIDTIFPGILIIDTPGHESFTNLRSRGSSVCNIAILVIDIMHSLEQQTLESIEMLRMRKTPFVIALNKIDRIYKWKNLTEIHKGKEHSSTAEELFLFDLTRQEKEAQGLFNQKINEIKLALSEKGLNTILYTENQEPHKIISIVPTSAVTGEGIPDLFSVIINLCEMFMKKKLTYNKDNFDCTVLEVKNEEGHGITVDAILSNGVLKEGDKLCMCGFEGPIITTLKTILVPEACKESRAKPILVGVKKVIASLGVKISGSGLEKVICGTSILKIEKKKKGTESNAYTEDKAKKIVMEELNSVLNSIETQEIGVHVQASTLGSLEALLNFLKDKVPVSTISIGNMRKKDIIKASTMVEKKKEFALMLCFDIKIEKEMEELALEMGVKIFSANIIYHLLESFEKYLKDVLEKKKEENKPVYPCRIKILPNCVWNKRSPIVMGVEVEGILTVGTILIRDDNFILGTVVSIENNKNNVTKAISGDRVAIKVETEEVPRLLGRHFEESDIFYSKMNRNNIDILKEYYKEDLKDKDWHIIIDIKRIFEII